MTIMATHFAIVLGAWRLRIRIDLDEPREADLRDAGAAPNASHATESSPSMERIGAWGRG